MAQIEAGESRAVPLCEDLRSSADLVATLGFSQAESYDLAGPLRAAANGLELLAAEAARVFGVSVAWVGLLRQDGEQVVAAVGMKPALIPLELSIAARIQDADDVILVPDATLDSRFRGHPLVMRPPHFAFIAAVPLRDAGGHFLGALSMLAREPRSLTPELIEVLRFMGRQLSIELRVRDELVEASERFHDFFEQTADLLLSISAEGTILHANDTAREVLGVTRGSRLEEYADPERSAELTEALERAFAQGEPVRVETVFASPARGKVILEGWLRPKILAGAAALARVVFRDVTDRKQFENELTNARDAAMEAARTKTTFLANVSHEIRTPMNGIIGMIDLLLASQLDAEQQDFAHQARSSAEQLLSIVSNILYISNLQAGSLGAHQVDFDLQSAMLRIVEVMKVAALGKDVTVRFDYDAALPAILRGNQSKIRHVVGNLMDNAVRFTTTGEVVLRVSLETETDTHRVVRFEVRDTGIGIANEARLLLFERFSQVEAGSTRAYSGAGLGLATARHLVETMGGLIDVDSTPGKGSLFWFTIPLRKVAAGSHPIASSDFDLRGKRVLLLDRQTESQGVLLHYLRNTWEMRTDVIGNGGEAIASLRAAAAAGDPYRLVIFEAVPDLEPRELARIVRADPRTANAGLIQMIPPSTAMMSVVDEASLRASAIDAWTYKPIGQSDLFDAIAIAMARQAIPLPHVPETPPRESAASRQAPLHPVRILLAEDNFLNMKLTISQLKKLGHVADTVRNGREAVAAVQRQPYDVVLMDCQMPVMDGYAATAEIRRLEREGLPPHRIIAMTANALEGDRERCLAAGMDDYLSKPTHHEEIEQALERWAGAQVGL
ncbi:MAG: response regulator [Acidobacteria bacterium]|nr:response regulator [Acidobacteriota bacterium]MBV9186148.1 response regulator [Acidobacteriota bacterium]